MIKLDNRNPGSDALLGAGTFAMTIDQGADMDQYQGLARLGGRSLSESAQHYFRQSEQVPTRIHLAAAQVQIPGEDPRWVGGGVMIQRVANDVARKTSDNNWETAKALFETITDEELVDPDTPLETLLYRLFHEQGARVTDTHAIEARCQCSRERLHSTLKSFDRSAVEDMAENNEITATCEFCASSYTFSLEEIQSA